MGVVAINARRIMNEKCLKQTLIARKAGYDPKLFSALLAGRKIIREEHILAIAKALNVSPGDLYVDHDELLRESGMSGDQ